MKSLKTRLLCMIFTVVALSNICLTVMAYMISSKELTKVVVRNMDSVVERVTRQVYDDTDKQFLKLKTISMMTEIKNPDLPAQEKERFLSVVTAGQTEFNNITFFNISGIGYSGDEQIDFSEKDYFKAAVKGGYFAADPFASAYSKSFVMAYAIPVYDYSSNIIGVLVAFADGTKLSELVKSITIGKNSHPYIIDMQNGQIVGDADIEKAKAMANISSVTVPELRSYFAEMCSGRTGNGSFDDNGTKMAVAYAPVGSNCTWAVSVAVPYEDFYSGLQVMTVFMMTSCIISVLASLVLAGILVSVSLRPLKGLNSSIKAIASGSADLTKRIKVTSSDEIGGVVTEFNKFCNKLMNIIAGIKQSKNDLTDAGNKLQESSEDTAASITQILSHIGNMHDQITGQAASVEETAGAVNQIATNIQSLEKMIETQSAGVTQASAAVEEMISNIGSVNNSVSNMALSFTELQKNARDGRNAQRDVKEKIGQIQNQSQLLQAANLTIADIAARTNLLAMNAAIEAAHAGNAGKGFSVVADEIRKLSETSSAQSKAIGVQLDKIHESIQNVAAASTLSTQTFDTVSTRISATDEIVQQIKCAMDEQIEGSRQIRDSLHSMNDSTAEVRTASSEMSDGNQAIIDEMKRLQCATASMKDSMNEMSGGAEKISRNGKVLHEVAEKMSATIADIGCRIDQFTV